MSKPNEQVNDQPHPAPRGPSNGATKAATRGTGAAHATHLDTVLAYVASGHRVVLLHEVLPAGGCSCANKSGTCPKPSGKDSTGKHPRESKWLANLIVDEHAAMRAWGRYPTANVGLCPPEDVVVLDIDPRNGGNETFQRLVAELGDLEGPCAITGGGGHHYWIRLPAGLDIAEATRRINASLKERGPGIDLRTCKNQVVVAPSLHTSGRRYEWVTGRSVLDCKPSVPSSAWLSALGIEEGGQDTGSRSQTAHDDDDLARAEWGLIAERLLDPDRGYSDWFRVGAALKPLGEEGLRLWIESSRPSKDFDEAEIRRKWSGIAGSSVNALFGMFDDFDPTWRARWRDRSDEKAKKGPGKPPAEPITPTSVTPRTWPSSLSSHVRQGLLGEFLEIVEEETEADPAAMVLDLLTRVGNAVGRGPHFEVGGDRHGCNLNVAIVGDTGQGRKGTSAAYSRQAMAIADETWAKARCLNGLSSGEGVIWAVRDAGPSGKVDKEGEPIIDPGVSDKRLLVVETELARTLRAAGRIGSTLTAILRQAWEGGRLAVMTKVPYSASDVHVSLLAHVTETELRSLLCGDDVHGGTANRFLFACSRRQRELPFGGEVDRSAFAQFGQNLRAAVERGSKLALLGFTDPAREVWPAYYSGLLADERTSGLRGALLARAVVQVRRLAMIFAVLDKANAVGVPHLEGALEVWRYCRDSVTYIFGSATGNPVADRLLGEMRGTPEGLDRTGMHKLFDRHVSAQEINNALGLLHQLRLAHGLRIPTSGRPRELWRACE